MSIILDMAGKLQEQWDAMEATAEAHRPIVIVFTGTDGWEATQGTASGWAETPQKALEAMLRTKERTPPVDNPLDAPTKS